MRVLLRQPCMHSLAVIIVRRGKIKPFQIMEKSSEFTQVFGQLGLALTVDDDVQKAGTVCMR